MTYSLWDTEIGKFLGRYTSEDEALGIVRTLVDHYGDDYAECLSLGRVAENGAILDPIVGSELAARAKTHATQKLEDERRPVVIGARIGRGLSGT